jgi:hypothetical protein
MWEDAREASSMRGDSAEKVLVSLLRLGGSVMLLAWLAALLPTAWMAACHRWLGLGPFPAAPLTEYLTRSISLLYGMHGGLLLVLSADVRRYLPVVRYLAYTTVLFGLIMLAVDLRAGVPGWWTLVEGPPLVAVGTTYGWLARALATAPAPADRADAATPGPSQPAAYEPRATVNARRK